MIDGVLNLSYDIIKTKVKNSYGKKGIPLVILHGLLGNNKNFATFSRQFTSAFSRDIYLVDLRNHGESPHHHSHTYQEMRNDVVKFLNDQDIEKCDILGFSMGGKVAMSIGTLKNNLDISSDAPEYIQSLYNYPMIDFEPEKRTRSLIVGDIAPNIYDSLPQNEIDKNPELKNKKSAKTPNIWGGPRILKALTSINFNEINMLFQDSLDKQYSNLNLNSKNKKRKEKLQRRARLRAISETRKQIDSELEQFITEDPIRKFLLTNLGFDNDSDTFYWKSNVPTIQKNIGNVSKFPGLIINEKENKQDVDWGVLKKYNNPTLFLRGELSHGIIPSQHEMMIKTLFPKYQIRVFERAHHWIHSEKPYQFYREIETFFNQIDKKE